MHVGRWWNTKKNICVRKTNFEKSGLRWPQDLRLQHIKTSVTTIFLHLGAAMVALKAHLQGDGGDIQNRNGGHLTATQARLV